MKKPPSLVVALTFLAASAAQATAVDGLGRVVSGERLNVIAQVEGDYLNIRSSPDPNSKITGRIGANAANIIATGKSQVYGDTWWVQIRHGGSEGWVNSRFVYRSGQSEPASPIDTSGQFKKLNYRIVSGGGYVIKRLNSYEECERLCRGNPTCEVFQYVKARRSCSLHKLGTQIDDGNADVGIKQRIDVDATDVVVRHAYTEFCETTLLAGAEAASYKLSASQTKQLRESCRSCFHERITRWVPRNLVATMAGFLDSTLEFDPNEASRARVEYFGVATHCVNQLGSAIEKVLTE